MTVQNNLRLRIFTVLLFTSTREQYHYFCMTSFSVRITLIRLKSLLLIKVIYSREPTFENIFEKSQKFV